MNQIQSSKRYDLEDRTFKFAKRVRDFIKNLPRTLTNSEYSKQLVRSSASIGANYIEANESLSKKDFLMRAMICRKEAKETEYWLKLIELESSEKIELLNEVIELRKIFGSIVVKSK